ncbi:uncharacterized protein [Antedon mediterranea]|uniref:uncharacterized protein n=1 Tax=Antedon mediterranea TaxID=105859 RepID=UPI003AF9F565
MFSARPYNGSPTNAYRYNDTNERYEYYQQLTGKSDAKQIEHFIINGQLYVFVINYKIGEKENIDSYIYIFDSRTGFLAQHQTLDTWGGHDASYLELNSNHYLLVVDYREQHSVVNSTVYKWNFNNTQFVEYAKIPVRGGHSGKLFSMDGVLYAAIANYLTTTNEYTIKSHVWKLKQGGVTELVQSLDESGAGSTGIDAFTNDGDTFLVGVNKLGMDCAQNTIVYRWDKSTNEFKIHQRIPVEHCAYRSTIFKVGGEVFIIIATTRSERGGSSNDKYTSSSPIFKLEGITMFIKYGAMTSHACFDITFFERDGEYFLGQSNIRNVNGGLSNAALNIYQWL